LSVKIHAITTATVFIIAGMSTASAAVEDIRLLETTVSKGDIAESYDAFGPATEYDRAEAIRLRFDLKEGDWFDPFANWQIPATVQGYESAVSPVGPNCSIGASAGVRCNGPDDLLLAEMEYLDATGDDSDQKEQGKLGTGSDTVSTAGSTAGSDTGSDTGEDATSSNDPAGMTASGVASTSSQGMDATSSNAPAGMMTSGVASTSSQGMGAPTPVSTVNPWIPPGPFAFNVGGGTSNFPSFSGISGDPSPIMLGADPSPGTLYPDQPPGTFIEPPVVLPEVVGPLATSVPESPLRVMLLIGFAALALAHKKKIFCTGEGVAEIFHG
jgi:hypothetical protein